MLLRRLISWRKLHHKRERESAATAEDAGEGSKSGLQGNAIQRMGAIIGRCPLPSRGDPARQIRPMPGMRERRWIRVDPPSSIVRTGG